ncbi:MAG: hypothetical protein EBZ69_01790, partial [Alphaproteobacteria bacterium]|nr:hypothetical protein [Alphaproteobacteria bacterium]
SPPSRGQALAGIHSSTILLAEKWIPAFAGMTIVCVAWVFYTIDLPAKPLLLPQGEWNIVKQPYHP